MLASKPARGSIVEVLAYPMIMTALPRSPVERKQNTVGDKHEQRVLEGLKRLPRLRSVVAPHSAL